MIYKSFILPFVVLTTSALTQAVNAEILIVRKETSVPAPSVQTAPSAIQASYVQSNNTAMLTPASMNTAATNTTLSENTQKELVSSVNSKEFTAPSFATSVSSQNANKFNKNIPQYSTAVKLRNPPPYVGCFYTSSRKYGVPVDLLMAIAQTESSFRHDIKGRLGHGADHGLMQINDYWVPKLRKRFNITLTDIYNPCTNIEIASWILAHNFVQFGYSWRAVGAYNAVTEWKRVRYINKVAANLNKLHAGQI